MRNRRIPKKVRLHTVQYKVNKVQFLKGGELGQIRYKQKEIDIARNYYSKLLKKLQKVSRDEQWEVFWHEVLHGILRDMKRHDLNNDRFINAFCRRLYTALKG